MPADAGGDGKTAHKSGDIAARPGRRLGEVALQRLLRAVDVEEAQTLARFKDTVMYDLIGDIHGHADELVHLLGALGYDKAQGAYRHPERKVIFLGDFIDRGPQIRQALEIVRPMTEEGTALAVMGNHEFNALAYHTEDAETPGEHLRRRIPKNVKQHSATLEQLAPQELRSYLEWFRTLPLWLDLDGLRLVHACWDDRRGGVRQRPQESPRTHDGVPALGLSRGHPLLAPVEIILKGKEGKLPDGESSQDKDGYVRTEDAHPLVYWPDGRYPTNVCPPV